MLTPSSTKSSMGLSSTGEEENEFERSWLQCEDILERLEAQRRDLQRQLGDWCEHLKKAEFEQMSAQRRLLETRNGLPVPPAAHHRPSTPSVMPCRMPQSGPSSTLQDAAVPPPFAHPLAVPPPEVEPEKLHTIPASMADDVLCTEASIQKLPSISSVESCGKPSSRRSSIAEVFGYRGVTGNVQRGLRSSVKARINAEDPKASGCDGDVSPQMARTRTGPRTSRRHSTKLLGGREEIAPVKSLVDVATCNEDGNYWFVDVARRFFALLGAEGVSPELSEKIRSTVLWKRVHGMRFQVVCSVVILMNAIFIGTTTQLWLDNVEDSVKDGMTAVEVVFCMWFAFELVLRFIAERVLFFVGGDWRWNLLDTSLVFVSIIDLVAHGAGSATNVTTARILRLTRFLKLIRILRAARAFHSFRILVLSIVASWTSLLWCFLVVVFIIYMFAIFFLQGVAEHLQDSDPTSGGPVGDDDSAAVLREYYGTVFRAMVTLFKTISGGVDWGDAVKPLTDVSWLYEPIFLLYLFFMYFGVLNVMIGAIVANTAEISTKDRQAVIKQEISRLTEYARKVRTFFSEADTDQSGLLSWEEFELYLADPHVKAYFQALELDVSQAHVLFKLLDVDESNQVGLEEFFDGCMKLKGGARSIDVNMLLYESGKVSNRLFEFIDFVEERLGKPKEHQGSCIDPKKKTSTSEDLLLPRRRKTVVPTGIGSTPISASLGVPRASSRLSGAAASRKKSRPALGLPPPELLDFP